MDLYDLNGPNGEDNDGGIKGRFYFAPERSFAVAGLKGPKTTALPGDSVTIDGSHMFPAGEGFVQCYLTQDSGDFKLEPTGERDGRGQKATLEFFYPGSAKVAAEFARRIKNLSGIGIIELADGTKLQLGQKDLGIEVLGSFSAGKQSGGRRGWTFKAEFFTNSLYYYEGDIVLKSAPAEPEV